MRLGWEVGANVAMAVVAPHLSHAISISLSCPCFRPRCLRAHQQQQQPTPPTSGFSLKLSSG